MHQIRHLQRPTHCAMKSRSTMANSSFKQSFVSKPNRSILPTNAFQKSLSFRSTTRTDCSRIAPFSSSSFTYVQLKPICASQRPFSGKKQKEASLVQIGKSINFSILPNCTSSICFSSKKKVFTQRTASFSRSAKRPSFLRHLHGYSEKSPLLIKESPSTLKIVTPFSSTLASTSTFNTLGQPKNLAPFKFGGKRTLFVKTDTTPNPDSLKFIPGKEVLPQNSASGGESTAAQTVHFNDVQAAKYSPLALKLFKIDGVKSVFLGNDFLTVTKGKEFGWEELKLLVISEIMEHYESGNPVITEVPDHADTMINEEDDEIVQMIKQILETRIRPTIQDDGGDIVYKGFADGIVYLQMTGSCEGCPSSSITLKRGIENMLMHWIPEVLGVVAVDDDLLKQLNETVFRQVDQEVEAKEKHTDRN